MLFIAHRINTIKDLNTVSPSLGIEIDVRDCQGEIVLSHDPFLSGEKLSDFLNFYQHKMLVINIKSSGTEKKVAEILKLFNISDFFFLDSSMSQIYSLKHSGLGHFAGRISEFESIKTIELSSNLLEWVWIDCFTRYSLQSDLYAELKHKLKLKVCLTSPDLLGRGDDISLHARLIRDNNCYPDAICTKLSNIDVWKKLLTST